MFSYVLRYYGVEVRVYMLPSVLGSIYFVGFFMFIFMLRVFVSGKMMSFCLWLTRLVLFTILNSIKEEGMNLFIKNFDGSLHRRLKVLAAQKGITLKKVVEMLLLEVMKRKG